LDAPLAKTDLSFGAFRCLPREVAQVFNLLRQRNSPQRPGDFRRLPIGKSAKQQIGKSALLYRWSDLALKGRFTSLGAESYFFPVKPGIIIEAVCAAACLFGVVGAAQPMPQLVTLGPEVLRRMV